MIVYQPVYIREFDDTWCSPIVFRSYEDAQVYIVTQQQNTWRKGTGSDYWSIDKLELA